MKLFRSRVIENVVDMDNGSLDLIYHRPARNAWGVALICRETPEYSARWKDCASAERVSHSDQ